MVVASTQLDGSFGLSITCVVSLRNPWWVFPPAVMTPDATPSPMPWSGVGSSDDAGTQHIDEEEEEVEEEDSATSSAGYGTLSTEQELPQYSDVTDAAVPLVAVEDDVTLHIRAGSTPTSVTGTPPPPLLAPAAELGSFHGQSPSSGVSDVVATIARLQPLSLAGDDCPAGRARARLGSKPGDWARYSISLAVAEGERMRKADVSNERRRRLMIFHWQAVQTSLQVCRALRCPGLCRTVSRQRQCESCACCCYCSCCCCCHCFCSKRARRGCETCSEMTVKTTSLSHGELTHTSGSPVNACGC